MACESIIPTVCAIRSNTFNDYSTQRPHAWIVAEKILMPDENVPKEWPIAGTTGYDFLNQVLRVFIDPKGETLLTEFYAEFTGESTDYPALARDKKHLVMRDLFASDINRLSAQLTDVCENNPRYRDYTRRELNSMLREVIACLSVYRTYVQADENRINDIDKHYIDEAVDAAKANRPDLDAELFEFFRSIWRLEVRGSQEADLVMRFQQSTGPVMAKGVEDTLFYNYNRFVALNDVGSEPNRFAISPEIFHQRNQEDWHRTRTRCWPLRPTIRSGAKMSACGWLFSLKCRSAGRLWFVPGRRRTTATGRSFSPTEIWSICTIRL